jgi:TorA maturation chaperone TorD
MMSDHAPDEATARADLCRFLSACYYEPAPEFAEENLFNSLWLATRQAHPDLAEQARTLGEAFASQDLQTLLVDYTRLFLGPLHALAPPYGSTWLQMPALAEGNPPPAVLDLYSEGGFDIDAEFSELPDHVAVELEFLYLLTFNKQVAAASNKADEVAAIECLQRRLFDEHLGVWITPFAAAVKAGAATAFYRELADFTARFVLEESRRLAIG